MTIPGYIHEHINGRSIMEKVKYTVNFILLPHYHLRESSSTTRRWKKKEAYIFMFDVRITEKIENSANL